MIMATDPNPTIGNAVEIINRFGGIRPMSAKTGIPVTTIQGWKQRDAIPANRRYDLVEAANKNGINLGRLLIDIAGSDIDTDEESPAVQETIRKDFSAKIAADPDLRPANNHVVFIAAGALVLAAAMLVTVLAMTPKLNELSYQRSRIQDLEQQIAAMRDAQDSQLRPAKEWSSKLSSLEGKVDELTTQAKSYGAVIADLQTGTMAQRLSKLEGHVGTLLKQANAFGLQDMLQKLQIMQSSPEGLGHADGLVDTFLNVTKTTKPDELTQAFVVLKDTDPAVAETFKNVAPEDMKAAVMLLGMSQLRDSLARDGDSFDSDLSLLKVTLAKDDPQLQAAIDRLAPQSKKGVLTPNGLSKELRGLTGEIVSSSLSGNDISVKDKAMARLSKLVTVEKNGQQVSGTDTQIIVAEAQKKLDAGDIEGAVALLQQVKGPAAEKTEPIINQAKATMMAGQVQEMLGQNLILKLKGLASPNVPYIANGGPSQVIDQIKTIGGVGR
jgi:hypothetical protein